jgi:UPF0716 family protein affecting phage T7 exclusion
MFPAGMVQLTVLVVVIAAALGALLLRSAYRSEA